MIIALFWFSSDATCPFDVATPSPGHARIAHLDLRKIGLISYFAYVVLACVTAHV